MVQENPYLVQLLFQMSVTFFFVFVVFASIVQIVISNLKIRNYKKSFFVSYNVTGGFLPVQIKNNVFLRICEFLF